MADDDNLNATMNKGEKSKASFCTTQAPGKPDPQATPHSDINDNRTPQQTHNTPGGGITAQMQALPTTTPKPSGLTQLQDDLSHVRHVLQASGGTKAQKPPTAESVQGHKGQKVKLFNQDMTVDDFDEDELRPSEDSLPRMTAKDFLPPASTEIIPLDFQVDPQQPAYV